MCFVVATVSRQILLVIVKRTGSYLCRGGFKMGRGGGQVKFYPYKEGGMGAGKVLAILKGGGGQF